MFRLEKKIICQGTPPPPEYQEIAMATRRAVCLLRSRRRTLLLQNNFGPNFGDGTCEQGMTH